jgi:hypothetical protein
MLLMDSFHLGDQGSVNSASMNPVALAMSNKPVACIVLTASFQRYIVADIPILSGHYLHAA